MCCRGASWSTSTSPADPPRWGGLHADLVTDGPFIDSKEVVAGFYVIEAPDLDAALAIVKRNPALPMGARLEVRPVHSGYTRPAQP